MAESSPAADILKEGLLSKQGGGFHNWKKRYCVLRENSLSYYAKKDDSKPKKIINLTKARGIREKKHCALQDWPVDVELCFGLASSKRTWYFYGSDEKDVKEWIELTRQCIEKVGKPTDDWKNDPKGKPEGKVAKVVRVTAKTVIKHGKGHIPSTDNKYLDGAISTAANMAEDQLDADPHASAKDRLKIAGGGVISGVADIVDNPAVSMAANLAKDQLKADEDLSLKQRLLLAGGSALEGVGEVAEIDAVGIAGGVIKDQATADEGASLKERLAIGVGSAAAGIKDCTDNALVSNITKAVENGAEEVTDYYADKRDTP